MVSLMDVMARSITSERAMDEKHSAGPEGIESQAARTAMEESVLAGLAGAPHTKRLSAVRPLSEAEVELRQADRNPRHLMDSAFDLCGALAGGAGTEALEGHAEHFNEMGQFYFKHDWHIANINQVEHEGCMAEGRASDAEACAAASHKMRRRQLQKLRSRLVRDFDAGRSPLRPEVARAELEVVAHSPQDSGTEQLMALMLAQHRETALTHQQEEEAVRQQANLENMRYWAGHVSPINGNSAFTRANASADQADFPPQEQPRCPAAHDDISFKRDWCITEVPVATCTMKAAGTIKARAAESSAAMNPDWPAVEGSADMPEKSPEDPLAMKAISQLEVRALQQWLLAAEASADALLMAGPPSDDHYFAMARQPRKRPQ